MDRNDQCSVHKNNGVNKIKLTLQFPACTLILSPSTINRVTVKREKTRSAQGVPASHKQCHRVMQPVWANISSHQHRDTLFTIFRIKCTNRANTNRAQSGGHKHLGKHNTLLFFIINTTTHAINIMNISYGKTIGIKYAPSAGLFVGFWQRGFYGKQERDTTWSAAPELNNDIFKQSESIICHDIHSGSCIGQFPVWDGAEESISWLQFP